MGSSWTREVLERLCPSHALKHTVAHPGVPERTYVAAQITGQPPACPPAVDRLRRAPVSSRTVTDAASSKAVVRAHFEVLNTGDYSQLDALHDADGRNHAPAAFDLSPWPAEGRPFGPADVRATFEWLRGALPDLHVSILDLIAEGDLVVARVRMSGTQTGDFGSVPATGKTVDFKHVHIFRLDNARIVEHWAVRDDLRAMLQLGVVAQPGAT